MKSLRLGVMTIEGIMELTGRMVALMRSLKAVVYDEQCDSHRQLMKLIGVRSYVV